MNHDAVMKRITISLEDDLYRIAKAYAISEGLSLSKAVGRLLRKAIEGPPNRSHARVAEESERYRYVDARTGVLVSIGDGTITEEAVKAAEEEEDERTWKGE